ncbi:uncharacterized protein LOC111683717 [Lucilia cuprina]|uniref:uncharacterized protein LOC111683717 n=1 Tax=Lucilia cuprina TaxID=7375 RepID=UPI001F0620A6|nr:uncharacterized protein LOC111683717 [Lucilia cuprina]
MREEFINGRNLAFGFFVNTMFADYNNILLSNVENTFLFQDCRKGSGDLMLKNLLEIIKYRPFISAQELEMILKKFCAIMAISKGNAEMYFYSVNPALAIIINNYYFTNQNSKYGIREGSEKDVLHLIHQFQISGTPHIVMQDFKRSEILKLIECLRLKDLKPLKCLYFIIMTHATKNNIIYTNDGELNFIGDILEPLQSNSTLQNAHITFVNVHCRGNLNGLYIDPDDSSSIAPTKIPQLQPNTSVLYSVPDLMVSPRHRNSGTPFVSSFSKAYGKLECSSLLRYFGLLRKICRISCS